jgi:hypothetical protein
LTNRLPSPSTTTVPGFAAIENEVGENRRAAIGPLSHRDRRPEGGAAIDRAEAGTESDCEPLQFSRRTERSR